MNRQFSIFLLRWIVNSAGIWIAVRVFGTGYSDQQLQESWWVFPVAGLVFSLVNAVMKPLVVILSLPAILLTLGLFTIVVNGFMVWVALALAPGISMTFGYAILAGIVLSLVNYIVSASLELKKSNRVQE